MRTYTKIIIAIVICAIGFGIVLWLKKEKVLPEKAIYQPIPVEAVKAKSGSILRRITTVGSLSAIQSVVLRPEVSGKIAKIFFQDGENVKAGDPLYKIDDAVYAAKVKEAEAHLALNKEEHSRAIKLLEKNFGTIQQRDRTLAEVQVSEAVLEEAKIRLDNTIIKAPFEGVMGLSAVSVGAFVSESVELVNIVDLDPINVDFHVPESYLPSVHPGDEVDVTIEDFDPLPVPAVVKAIDPKIDEATRTVIIRAQMPNKELAYRPGEFARVTVLAGTIKDAVLIPEVAVEREGDEEHVMLVVDNIAVKSVVSTGMREGNEVEITHGVKVGDLVITAGQFKVQDGVEVQVVNQNEEQEETE
ncbi:MAG: efflux RND transporter periplasmic adaptor subunit [Alphaproteobacteria bacterium]|nr:efflux RND transporter periplasmic adaptor subunit [Alphaproteobacteria bacterium]